MNKKFVYEIICSLLLISYIIFCSYFLINLLYEYKHEHKQINNDIKFEEYID